MNILYLDSSEFIIKVGLVCTTEDSVPDKTTVEYRRCQHSTQDFHHFFTYLDEVLFEHKLTTRNIDVIVVNKGPGSFIGCRMAVMVAKTLSYLNNQERSGQSDDPQSSVKLYGIDTFLPISWQLSRQSTLQLNSESAVLNKNGWIIKPLLKSNFIIAQYKPLSSSLSQPNKVYKIDGSLSEIIDQLNKGVDPVQAQHHEEVFEQMDEDIQYIFALPEKMKEGFLQFIENINNTILVKNWQESDDSFKDFLLLLPEMIKKDWFITNYQSTAFQIKPFYP